MVAVMKQRRLGVIEVVAMLAVGFAGASCQRSRWVVHSQPGAQCVVENGWTPRQVRERCGMPAFTGTRVKMTNDRGWSLRSCSAPGDIYGAQVVLYDCDIRVIAVKILPADGFSEHTPWRPPPP
jgi:hypothetical protein